MHFYVPKSALKYFASIFPANFQLPSLQIFCFVFIYLWVLSQLSLLLPTLTRFPRNQSPPPLQFSRRSFSPPTFSITGHVLELFWKLSRTDLSSASQTHVYLLMAFSSFSPPVNPSICCFNKYNHHLAGGPRWSKRETQEASRMKLPVFPLLTVNWGLWTPRAESPLSATNSRLGLLKYQPLPKPVAAALPPWSPRMPGPCYAAGQLQSQSGFDVLAWKASSSTFSPTKASPASSFILNFHSSPCHALFAPPKSSFKPLCLHTGQSPPPQSQPLPHVANSWESELKCHLSDTTPPPSFPCSVHCVPNSHSMWTPCFVLPVYTGSPFPPHPGAAEQQKPALLAPGTLRTCT